MNEGFALPSLIRLHNCRLLALTFACPVRICCPLNQNSPKLNASCPYLCNFILRAGVLRHENSDDADRARRLDGFYQRVGSSGNGVHVHPRSEPTGPSIAAPSFDADDGPFIRRHFQNLTMSPSCEAAGDRRLPRDDAGGIPLLNRTLKTRHFRYGILRGFQFTWCSRLP